MKMIRHDDGHIATRDDDGVFVIAMAGWPSTWSGRDAEEAARLWQGMAHTHDEAGLAAARADVNELIRSTTNP